MDVGTFDPLNSPPVEDADTQIEQMVTEIRMAKRCVFLYALCNSSSQQRKWMDGVEARLPQRKIQRVVVPNGEANLLHLLRDAAESSKLDVVFVHGWENWLSGAQDPNTIPLLNNLNAARDSFPTVVSGALILWMSQYVLKAIADAAPDFLSVRSGVYTFPIDPTERQQMLQEIARFDQTELLGMTPSERDAQIQKMSELLSEIRSLPEEQRNRLDEAFVLNRLAIAYEAGGTYSEALPLFLESLSIYRKLHPPNYQSIATSLNNLANLYQSMNRFTEALPLFHESLAIRRKLLSARHPSIAISLNNLASLYHSMDRFADALPLYQEALAIRREALPKKHPDIAQILNNLASLYHSMDRFADALPLYQEALSIYRDSLPPEHPNIATILNNLGSVYYSMNQLSDALPLYQEALSIRRASLPASHPDIATTINNLASVYRSMKNFTDALQLFEEAMATTLMYLGADHPHTQTVAGNLERLREEIHQYVIGPESHMSVAL